MKKWFHSFLLYVWRVFTLHTCLRHVLVEAQKEHRIPRIVLAEVVSCHWMLGTEPGPSAREVSAEPPLQPCGVTF